MQKVITIIGVRFRKAGKIYYFSPAKYDVKKGDNVIVETARGIEYGAVVLGPKGIPDDEIVQPLKQVIRIATPADDKIEEKKAMITIIKYRTKIKYRQKSSTEQIWRNDAVI